MKTLIIFCIAACIAPAALAQSPADTARVLKDTVRSAWSQRPDTAVGNKQPLSQPFADPPAPQMTNPINNPTSGQTNEPPVNPATELPPPVQWPDTLKKQHKTLTPVTPKVKPSNYDTLPGTKRNG